MDMSTIKDEIPETLRSAYEVNLPPATFGVDELVAGGRRRRRRGAAGRVAGGAVAAAAIAGVAVAGLSAGGGAGRVSLAPPAAPSVRTILTGPGRTQLPAGTGDPVHGLCT